MLGHGIRRPDGIIDGGTKSENLMYSISGGDFAALSLVFMYYVGSLYI